jgi:hypothetical protein
MNAPPARSSETTQPAARFDARHLEAWRRDGGVSIPGFFTPAEVAAVQADFETVFGGRSGGEALVRTPAGETGRFHPAQFTGVAPVPLDCSPALNLIGVHPALIAFARAALKAEAVHVYQCQAWAKFTGEADFDQPFHCDFANHTLTAPAEDDALNSVTILCYFSDVSEAHGPMHYVARPDSLKVAGPEATLTRDGEAHRRIQIALRPYERSSAGAAGAVFPYSIDVWHRGTNLTAPGGHRYALMTCFKAAGNDSIGFHAWAFHHTRPWSIIFENATPEQLACFGVPEPGHRFWTRTTLERAQARYPGWDLTPYREALAG